MALRERNFPTLDLLINLTQMMVEGELLQLERIGKIGVTEADYMELIDRKTASLFSACARLGAISAGAGEAVEARLGEYAWNLGIAFQLVDDILDFTSREKILGKPVGNDLREGKGHAAADLRARNRRRRGAQAGGDGAGRWQLRSGSVQQDPEHPASPSRHRAGAGARASVHRKSSRHHRRVSGIALSARPWPP